jgi:2-polyprenyl-3-methyl-5-hydroxy-6-metoxy-1,4-benzoquinol methylase
LQFYADSGHGDEPRQTLQIVIDAETRNPNSTIDAERMTGEMLDILKRGEVTDRSFLDVACGYGFFSKKALEKGFKVTSLEIAGTERGIAKEMTGLEPVPLFFEDYTVDSKSFSAILMSQILEHALDVNAWIAKVSALLIPGGVLAVALPNFNSFLRIFLGVDEPYICPPAHLNFFTKKSLEKLLKKHGLLLVSCCYVSRINQDVIKKRFPGIAGKILPVASMLRIADTLGIGMMLNMYAVKNLRP